MKTFKEFKKNFKNIKISKEKLNDFYDRYKTKCFNEWLAKNSTEDINKVGLATMYEIWDAMDCCDK